MTEASANKDHGGGVSGAVIVLVATLIAIYSISQFFRNSIGVIGPDLVREFDLDARALGLLASIFFLSFAALQIPLGIIIDRYGPKTAIVSTAMLAVIGTLLFAWARDYRELLAARLMIGAGCSSFFMGSLAIYALKFPPQRFSTMVGIQLGIGTIGALAATAPLAWSTANYGWRASFVAIGAVTFVLTLLVVLLVRDADSSKVAPRRRESLPSMLAGVLEATRVPSFWPVFLMQATNYSAVAAIIGLWGGPWLTDVYGMDLKARGNVLFMMVVVQIVGLFFWGPSDRLFKSYRTPGLIGGCICATIVLVGALAQISAQFIVTYLVLYGLAFSTTPVLTAHGRALFPKPLLGRGLTLMNIGTMGGVFAQQALTGFVIESFGATIVDGARIYPPEGYRAVLGLIAAELAGALLLYSRASDPHPDKAKTNQPLTP